MFRIAIGGRLNGRTIRQLQDLKELITSQSDKQVVIEYIDPSILNRVDLESLQDFLKKYKPKNKDSLLVKLELMKGRITNETE